MADRKKLLLRLDPRVYDAIARWAADDLRSVNAQIEYALRRALRAAGRAARDGPGRDDSGRDDSGRDGPGRDDSGRDGPGRDGPGRDGPGGLRDRA